MMRSPTPDWLTSEEDLEYLVLAGTAVSDAGLKILEGMNKIDVLEIGNTRFTDGGLAHLKGLTRLRHLALDNTAVSDVGLLRLAGLTRLQSLNLGGSLVTDAGIAHLMNMPSLRLRTLWLEETPHGFRAAGAAYGFLTAVPEIAPKSSGSSLRPPGIGGTTSSAGRHQHVLAQTDPEWVALGLVDDDEQVIRAGLHVLDPERPIGLELDRVARPSRGAGSLPRAKPKQLLNHRLPGNQAVVAIGPVDRAGKPGGYRDFADDRSACAANRQPGRRAGRDRDSDGMAVAQRLTRGRLLDQDLAGDGHFPRHDPLEHEPAVVAGRSLAAPPGDGRGRIAQSPPACSHLPRRGAGGLAVASYRRIESRTALS